MCPSYLSGYAKQYAAMTPDERHAEWDRLMGWSVEIVCRSAALLVEMLKHGEEPKYVREKYPEKFRTLMLVANGKIIPEAFHRFQGYTTGKLLLNKFKVLPVERQAEIIDKGMVEVAVRLDRDSFTSRWIALPDLTAMHVDQVFGPLGDRAFEPQVAWAEGRPASAPRPMKRKNIKIDRRSGGVWIELAGKKLFLSIGELEQLLSELRRG